jgi:hypothetical protein
MGEKQCFETYLIKLLYKYGMHDYLNEIEAYGRGHVCNYICTDKTHQT